MLSSATPLNLPLDVQEILLLETGLDTQDFLRMRLIDKAWNAFIEKFALGMLEKYFPYLLANQKEHCQKTPVLALFQELSFFRKHYPDISIALLLNAFGGRIALINALPMNRTKAVLTGILLSKASHTCEIAEYDKSTQMTVALNCAIRRRDFARIKELTGTEQIYSSYYFAAQAMALEYTEIALYFFRNHQPPKPDDHEKMLLAISKYDNPLAFENTAKLPEVSTTFLEKEFLGVDVTPSVRLSLLKAIKNKYQKPNYWVSTLFGMGESIWKLTGEAWVNYTNTKCNLLIWGMYQGYDPLIGLFLSVAKKDDWDFELACKAKGEALCFAAEHAKVEALKVLLADNNVPLSIAAKERALVLAKGEECLKALKDSMMNTVEQQADDSTSTSIWDCFSSAITFAYNTLTSSTSNNTTSAPTLPQHSRNKPT